MVGTRPERVRPLPAGRQAPSVGQQFRQARQRLGVSLALVADQLKIPLSQLEALEEGDFSVFSAEVYARGACLKYAQWLRLDVVRVEPAVLRELSGARLRIPLQLYVPLSWAQRLLTAQLLWLLAGGMVAAAVSGYILWQVQSFFRLPPIVLEAPAISIIAESSIEIRGRSPEASQVSVNGQSILLQPNGSFVTRLYLHPGINVLNVAATNAAGRHRLLTRTLLRPRP